MALRDVKEYYGKMLGQKLECNKDLEDFEQALKDGYITEDKLEAVKEDYAVIEENFNRLSYIMYLFNLPKNKKKKVKYKDANQSLEEYFESLHADKDSVVDETIDCIAHLREELKKLKK